jgi:hypothetical protein
MFYECWLVCLDSGIIQLWVIEVLCFTSDWLVCLDNGIIQVWVIEVSCLTSEFFLYHDCYLLYRCLSISNITIKIKIIYKSIQITPILLNTQDKSLKSLCFFDVTRLLACLGNNHENEHALFDHSLVIVNYCILDMPWWSLNRIKVF